MPCLNSKVLPPSPITVAEFYDVFAKLWHKPVFQRQIHYEPSIGTAFLLSFPFLPSDIS